MGTGKKKEYDEVFVKQFLKKWVNGIYEAKIEFNNILRNFEIGRRLKEQKFVMQHTKVQHLNSQITHFKNLKEEIGVEITSMMGLKEQTSWTT